ncbi:hypothetical protein K469DRAFT_685226 [Zopfia rhizophila CBS 207.26]|uniref:Uncharacterized protein n=1 Tax=Zopfia rhizophila CBS 207.26 TaxID=1314779 RepID=A0A6A6DA62_9PEZI|nr:hypothetical protein K469DRAFT_685226 [Zopfia rhizophila CBS 207.26]
MSRWINPERPWKLTTEQSASVNKDPRIERLLQRQAKLKGKLSRQDESKKLGKEIRKEKQRLRHALRVQIRKNWDREQAERDIQLQLSGAKFSDKMKTNLKRSPERTPQHNRLIETVLSLPGSSLKEEAYRRSAAIDAIIAYYNIEEGETPGVQHKALEAAIHSFFTLGDLSKHFKRKHLIFVKAKVFTTISVTYYRKDLDRCFCPSQTMVLHHYVNRCRVDREHC